MENFYKNEIVELIKNHVPLNEEEIFNLITQPPKKDMGDYAFPCFTLAKQLRNAPPKIAVEIVEKLDSNDNFKSIEAAGPYINFRLNKTAFTENIINTVLKWQDKQFSDYGEGKTVVIDYSSPNIAKPFTIGHLRSTNIGNSIGHIYDYLGYRVVRINHVGDWGTSFGKLIVAFRNWSSKDDLNEDPIKKLLDLYQRFNKEAKEKPEMEDEARVWFKKLEDGDAEALELWNLFKDLSYKEYERIYNIIGVRFDHYWGESYYQDKIDDLIKEIEDKKLSSISEGALIVDLEKYDMPPLLLKKQDGATLYATRDLAAALYRYNQFQFDEMIYVVGGEQALHFKQFFKVLGLMGYDWNENCHHINFGLILGKDGKKMSSRKGDLVFLDDVINEGRDRALEKLNESEAQKADKDKYSKEEKLERALQLGISSIFFADLKNNRQKDVIFDWDEVLEPKGETGVYLQYAHARLCGILRNFEKKIGAIESKNITISEESSFDIARELSAFKDKCIQASINKEPSIIARYLLDLAQAFSSYYYDNQVINEDNHSLSQERIQTVLAVKKVLADGLSLLGIKALDKM